MSESTKSLVEEMADDEYEYGEVDDLYEHPRNTEIYGEVDPGEGFVGDIERSGVETPLIVNEHEDCQQIWDLPNTVIGGHRRLEAAKRIGLNRVPIRWVSYPEPMATLRVINNNNQRTKTDGQITNEAMVAEEIYREQAVERQLSTQNNNAGPEKFPDLPKGDSRDFLAEEIGADTSGRTLGKGIEVQRMAYPEKYVEGKDYIRNPEKYDVSEEVREEARKQVEQMDSGEQSFHGAISEVEDKQEQLEREEYYEKDSKSQQDSLSNYLGKWGVEVGDVWIVGDDPRHRIVCGNFFDDGVRESLFDDSVPDVALSDPPYGIGEESNRGEGSKTGFSTSYEFPEVKGDDSTETALKSYHLMEDIGIDKMVLWGSKHYASGLPDSSGWVVWDKRVDMDSDDYSDCEMAWTNLDRAARVFRHKWRGAIKDSERGERRIHPTQKPVQLSEWLIEDFLSEDDVGSVVDPFFGSGSTGVACERCSVKFYGVEAVPEYVAAALERFDSVGLETRKVGNVG